MQACATYAAVVEPDALRRALDAAAAHARGGTPARGALAALLEAYVAPGGCSAADGAQTKSEEGCERGAAGRERGATLHAGLARFAKRSGRSSSRSRSRSRSRERSTERGRATVTPVALPRLSAFCDADASPSVADATAEARAAAAAASPRAGGTPGAPGRPLLPAAQQN
jgi:hypothetical protein